ncbi:hypothetical protein P5V15_007165 [Pogonomyrmex californicus]
MLLRCHCTLPLSCTILTHDVRYPFDRFAIGSTSQNVRQMFFGASDIHDGRAERHQAVAMLSLPRLRAPHHGTGVSRCPVTEHIHILREMKALYVRWATKDETLPSGGGMRTKVNYGLTGFVSYIHVIFSISKFEIDIKV